MDKKGCHFGQVIHSMRQKLPGANPVAIQLPLFLCVPHNEDPSTTNDNTTNDTNKSLENIMTVPCHSKISTTALKFVGVVNLVQMCTIVWPNDSLASSVKENIPTIVPLRQKNTNTSKSSQNSNCHIIQITQICHDAQHDMTVSLNKVDASMEVYYLNKQTPPLHDLLTCLQRAKMKQTILSVLVGVALQGKGMELLLDAIVVFLPSHLHLLPKKLIFTCGNNESNESNKSNGFVT